MCGGSNPLGNGVEALDNCVSIQPEVEEPTWLHERMVRIFISCVRWRY